MPFNNIVNHLKQWCIDKARIYQGQNGAYGGATYVGRLIAYELEFKLSTLIDQSFESIADLEREIRILVDIHYEPSILEPQNSLAQHIIHKTKKEFYEFLEDVLSKKESLPLSDMSYERVIIGSEANTLQDRFRSVWGYENTAYWFPLMGDEPKGISEKFFIMFDYFEPYMKQFTQLDLPRRKHRRADHRRAV